MATPATGPSLIALTDALAKAAATSAGREIVAAHDEDYEVSVEGEGGVIVRMRDGVLKLVDVSEGQPAVCAYTRVEFEPAGVLALANGSTTPAEAADGGGMLMRSRLSGGGQFMGLLRLAQKVDAFNH
jgi:hypothetical protein